MATYNNPTYKWKQGYFQCGTHKYPVTILSVDCGAALSTNDQITITDNYVKYPTSLIALAGFSQLRPTTPTTAVFNGQTIITGENYTIDVRGNGTNEKVTKIDTRPASGLYYTFGYFSNIGANAFWTYDTKYACIIYDEVGEKYCFNDFRILYPIEYNETYPWNDAGLADLDQQTPSYGVVYSHGVEYIEAHTTTIYGFLTDEQAADVGEATTDPYAEGGTSETGGGGGNFDLSSDAVDFPSLPTLSAVDTGLVSIYTPSLAQLKALATFLWNANPTDVDWWKKLVANPLDLILGLSIVPVAVPAGIAQNIKVGLIDTGVSVTKATTQFVEVDCGSIQIPEYWGSALDYSPFRRFSIYLPFIGTRTISTDDIMGKTVHVKYHVDLISGACVAMVKCGDAVLYQYSGACAVSLPLSGETFTNVITSTIQLAASIGATVATGGAAAGVTAASAANSLMSMKPIIERAGGVSGAAGQLGVMTPYLIGEIPRQSVPENANQFMGYPSNITAKLGDLTGFTSVDVIHMENVPATNAEKSELESILKAGVLL